MNDENLKKGKGTQFKTGEDAAQKGKKGGIASGEAKRERKTLKEELLQLLSEGDTQRKVSLALIKKAKSGNTKAFEVIRDTIGEKPMEKIITAAVDPEIIAEIERMVRANDEAQGEAEADDAQRSG